MLKSCFKAATNDMWRLSLLVIRSAVTCVCCDCHCPELSLSLSLSAAHKTVSASVAAPGGGPGLVDCNIEIRRR